MADYRNGGESPIELRDTTKDYQGSHVDKVKWKRSINLVTGCSMIMGTIIGAGIFVSPKGVLQNTGSTGLSLIIWAVCGVISTGGALCMAELGSMIPESGGTWAYIRVGMGPAPAYLFTWTLLVRMCASNALLSLVAAKHVITPFIDSDCGEMPYLMKLAGFVLLLLVLTLSAYNSLYQKIARYLLAVKLFMLLTVIGGGIYYVSTHGSQKLSKPFQGTTEDGMGVALGVYSGMYAFNGWYMLTFVTEEVQNPRRNIPLSIILSMCAVTVLYLMANVSYYLVLDKEQVLGTETVILEWAEGIFGFWSVLFSFLVALSALGASMNGSYGQMRQLACVARGGHAPLLLSMITVESGSPLIALLLRMVIASVLLLTSDGIYELLNFLSFLAAINYFATFVSLVKLKVTKYRDDQKRFRVPLVLPIIVSLAYLYLIIIPIVNKPSWNFLFAILFGFGGIIFYIPFVMFSDKLKMCDRVTVFFQLLLQIAVPDKDI